MGSWVLKVCGSWVFKVCKYLGGAKRSLCALAQEISVCGFGLRGSVFLRPEIQH